MTAVAAPTYRFSVEEYHKLGEAGIFDEDDRVELLNGEIVIMSPIGKRHAQAVTNLTMEFAEQARRRFMVSPQNPVWLDAMSEPQPDIVLVPWRKKARDHHPQPEEVFVVIEVADSSLRYDRTDKLRAYARTGVSEFWILNLHEDVLEVFRVPRGETYTEILRLSAGEKVSPLAFPDVIIALDAILP